MNSHHQYHHNPSSNRLSTQLRQYEQQQQQQQQNSISANSNPNNNANGSTPGGGNHNKEALVNKLQGVIQDLRRQRDQAHRSKELALERARLAREEEQALSKVVADMQQRLNQLTVACNKVQNELGPMEQTLQIKTKEMHFQHAELLGAREKIQQLHRSMEQSAKDRNDQMRKAQQLLCERQNKLQAMEQKMEATATAAILSVLKKKKQQQVQNGFENKQEEKVEENLSSFEASMTTAVMMPVDVQKEHLEREVNSGFFDWDMLPKVMENQAKTLTIRAQELHDCMTNLDADCGVVTMPPGV